MTYYTMSSFAIDDFVRRMRDTAYARRAGVGGAANSAFHDDMRDLRRSGNGGYSELPPTLMGLLVFMLQNALDGVMQIEPGERASRTAASSIRMGGYTLNAFSRPRDGSITMPSIDHSVEEGEPSTSNVSETPLAGWAEGYVRITPSEEQLATLPAGARPFAEVIQPRAGQRSGNLIQLFNGSLAVAASSVSAEELLRTAREKYRTSIRARLGCAASDFDAEFERKRKAHREKTKQNFEAFVRSAAKDTEEHILKLPFVPHGLASTRRWGIEVESGGARDVATPADWDAKSDGSLRSAYDGYVEVQDFEPFDEEVTESIHWESCVNRNRHNPAVSVYNEERGQYVYLLREDYIPVTDCDQCGNVTHMVHREPQTIHHEARGGDCREFVSPILTSMHSKGLEELTTALSKNPQNDSAGVHVHVEASDLNAKQIATMVYGYDILEPILEASYRRNRRDFCERRDASEVLEAARKSRTTGISGNEGGRYRTLNTRSLGAHGTLEFRAMGPVYEYDYLIRWAMLCRELVNAVANGATNRDFAKIKKWDDLTAFLAKFGKEYIRAAVYEMTGEVGEVARLEKAGEPVTTEALDTDLRNLLAGTHAVDEAFRGMARTISAVGATINTDMLAGVMMSGVEV